MPKHFITPRGNVEIAGNDRYLTVKINKKILHYMFDCLAIIKSRPLEKKEQKDYDQLLIEFNEIKKVFNSTS